MYLVDWQWRDLAAAGSFELLQFSYMGSDGSRIIFPVSVHGAHLYLYWTSDHPHLLDSMDTPYVERSPAFISAKHLVAYFLDSLPP